MVILTMAYIRSDKMRQSELNAIDCYKGLKLETYFDFLKLHYLLIFCKLFFEIKV